MQPMMLSSYAFVPYWLILSTLDSTATLGRQPKKYLLVWSGPWHERWNSHTLPFASSHFPLPSSPIVYHTPSPFTRFLSSLIGVGKSGEDFDFVGCHQCAKRFPIFCAKKMASNENRADSWVRERRLRPIYGEYRHSVKMLLWDCIVVVY